jgi:hypothetical protein
MGITTKDRPRSDSGSRSCRPNFRPEWPTRTPYIPSLPEFELARIIGQVAPTERGALQFIADNSDVIEAAGRRWLITLADDALLDVLAAVGAQHEDMELECQDEGAQCEDEGAIETDMSTGGDEPLFLGSREYGCQL